MAAAPSQTTLTGIEKMLFAILGWILFGLIIGALARLLVPGHQPIGLLKTMLLGIVGSFVGGFIGFLIIGGDPLQSAGWIGSLLGAIIVVAIFGRGGRQPVSHHSH
jgi:uncharacterized membrane protein YeaQ/YmgE (transglycosylase-associated protein family)